MSNATPLGGTKWNYKTSANVSGTLELKADNTGAFVSVEGTIEFFWWQEQNSFWMQMKSSNKGWLEIVHGELTGIDTGSGKKILGEQSTGSIYTSEFSMTKQ